MVLNIDNLRPPQDVHFSEELKEKLEERRRLRKSFFRRFINHFKQIFRCRGKIECPPTEGLTANDWMRPLGIERSKLYEL